MICSCPLSLVLGLLDALSRSDLLTYPFSLAVSGLTGEHRQTEADLEVKATAMANQRWKDTVRKERGVAAMS